MTSNPEEPEESEEEGATEVEQLQKLRGLAKGTVPKRLVCTPMTSFNELAKAGK